MRTAFLLWLAASAAVRAGGIRSVEANAERMEPVRLKLGQSTVLRFGERPRRVVVGNNNYVNIEFVGDDLTIQPQAPVTTNLFVYGKGRVYGFILRVVGGAHYDDIVNVRRRAVPPPKRETKEAAEFALGPLSVRLDRPAKTKGGAGVVDFTITNRGKRVIKTESLEVVLSDGGTESPPPFPVYSKDTLGEGERAKGRLLFKPREGALLTIRFGYKDDERAFIAFWGAL